MITATSTYKKHYWTQSAMTDCTLGISSIWNDWRFNSYYTIYELILKILYYIFYNIFLYFSVFHISEYCRLLLAFVTLHFLKRNVRWLFTSIAIYFWYNVNFHLPINFHIFLHFLSLILRIVTSRIACRVGRRGRAHFTSLTSIHLWWYLALYLIRYSQIPCSVTSVWIGWI